MALLSADLINRRLTPTPALAPAKWLCREYGVNYRTLKKALLELEATGLIRPYGRSWRLNTTLTPRPVSRVVLIARGDHDGSLLLLSSRSLDMVRLLEQQCSQRNLELAFQPIRLPSGAVSSHRTKLPVQQTHHAPESTLGYLVWAEGLGAEEVASVVGHVHQSRRPWAILSQAAEHRAQARGSTGRRFCFESDFGAGRSLGRHVCSRGHTKIAFISPYHGARWSQARLQGLVNACGEAGGVEVIPVVDTRFSHPHTMVSRHLDTLRSLEQQLRQMRSQAHNQDEYRVRIIEHYRSILDPTMEQVGMGILCRPLLEKACADTTVTCWVVANDESALAALDYLHQQGRAVPGDVAVAAFDDSLAATQMSLTSYNFNIGALNAAMLDHIVCSGDRTRRQTRKPQPLCISGSVTVRASTAGRTEPRTA